MGIEQKTKNRILQIDDARKYAEKFVNCLTPEGYASEVKFHLKLEYGIDNLSVIEESHLMRIIRECISEETEQITQVMTGLIKPASVAETEVEAEARWLFQLYDIKPQEVYKEWVIFEEGITPEGIKMEEVITYGNIIAHAFTKEYREESRKNRKAICTFPPQDTKEAKRKLQELQSYSLDLGLSKKYNLDFVVPPETKEYIRRVRERAHLI